MLRTGLEIALERSKNKKDRIITSMIDELSQRSEKMKKFLIVVEKHPDGYVAYPLGLKGVVVGEGDTNGEALADVKSAIRFHIDTFGQEVIG
jgi:predicted RNase H-like HicB family nuclease